MTIQALTPAWTTPVRAPSAAAEAPPSDRYLPAEEGTLPRQQPELTDRLAATRLLQQAGLGDVQCLVSWMASAAPPETRLEDFARRTLSGVRAITPDLAVGVEDLVRLAETTRRAELQDSPETCLDQGLEALALVFGPLERDNARCNEFRGLLAVLGNPGITFALLTDPVPVELNREAVIHEVVRELRERHEEGKPLVAGEVMQLRDQTVLELMGGPDEGRQAPGQNSPPTR